MKLIPQVQHEASTRTKATLPGVRLLLIGIPICIILVHFLSHRSAADVLSDVPPYYMPGCSLNKQQGFWAPSFYPIPPFRMVLGDDDKPCRHLPDCDAFCRGHLEWPEAFAMQVLIATLGDCPYGLRPCHVMDFGGNLGYREWLILKRREMSKRYG